MAEFFQKILAQVKNILSKLDKKQKLIAGAVVGVVAILLIMVVSSSSQPTRVYLFKRALSASDYAKITKKLQEYGSAFQTKDDRFVLVKDEATGAKLRMRLGQDKLLPSDIKGWELFDTEKWTTTDFERNVMKRRAIIGAMTRHLKMLTDIEDVKLTVSMPDGSLYIKSDQPWKASLTITPKPFSDLVKNKKKIKGIIQLVANGIDKLKPENIVITDNQGNVLSDFSGDQKTDYLVRAKAEYKLQQMMQARLEADLRRGLRKVLGEDRYDVRVKYELDFDQKTIDKSEIIPIVLQKDDPTTPYNERKVVLKAVTSQKETIEKFLGPSYVPEGPAGRQRNLPPGMVEKLNRFTKYNKKEVIHNNIFSRKKSNIKRAPYIIKKVGVAVYVDGTWRKVYNKGDLVISDSGSIKRKYTPVPKTILKAMDDIIRRAIIFDPGRGDQVAVRHIPFDRTKQFDLEDEEIRRKERLRKTLIAAVAALFVLFLGTLMYRAIAKEIARRKRIREEELALQQQRMREQALRAAEEEGVEVELSLEEKARLEMEENAINMARERPEDVAQLLRTWLLEE